MDQSQLLRVARALIGLCAAALPTVLSAALSAELSAQGPVYRERWGYLHLEHRRGELLQELQRAEPAAVAAVAELLAGPDDGVPFVPVAKALARLRGVEADAAFVLRSAISTFLLPEVCDPDGRNELCRTTNVSVFLPFTLPLPGAVSFAFEVADAGGKVVWQQTLDGPAELADLRMARPNVKVPCGELADGSYRLTLRTRIDGVLPRADEPVLQWPFHVLRGYQARAEAALAAVHAAVAPAEVPGAQLSTDDRALLLGLADPVQRAYLGEAFVVRSDAVVELQRLEQALANRAAERPLASGLTGDLPLALATGGELPLSCLLRPAAGAEPAPLVVVIGGAPSYDTTARQPTSPPVREPGWLAHELGQLAGGGRWHLAFVTSPGGGRNFGDALKLALPLLAARVATGGRLPIVVAEREAASLVGLRVRELKPLVSALVLVGGAGLPGPSIDLLDGIPVRMVRLHGLPAGDGLQRSLDYARQRAVGQGSEVSLRSDFAWLVEREQPWLFGLPLVQPELIRFVAQLAR